MAIVINPFFSLSASGTAGRITASERKIHRASIKAGRMTQAGKWDTAKARAHIMKAANRKPTRPPTAAQLLNRERMKSAAKAWKTLSPTDVQAWKNLTISIFLSVKALRHPITGCWITTTKIQLKHGYAAFVREYINQSIVVPDLPRIPSQSYGQVHP